MTKLYTVYKTTNSVNGKYYFGVHKTVNPNDGYLGSGTYIKRAIAKHGAENFRKEVLFIYLDSESAFGKEDELVQCYRRDPLCKNLRKGGSGGFDWINVHMPSRLDLTGQKFGQVFVLGFSGATRHVVTWQVRCSCGREKIVRTVDLRSGKVRACGKCWKIEQLTGKRFSRFVVLERDTDVIGSVWRCRCDCGKEKSVKAQSLKNGDAKSCGCFHPKRPTIYVGQKFGRLTVKARTANTQDRRSVWIVVCECGIERRVVGSSLTTGATKSCGCFRREVVSQLKSKTARLGQ